MGTVFSNGRGRTNNPNNPPPSPPPPPPPAAQLVGYGGYVLAYPLQPQNYHHASRLNPTSFDPQAHISQSAHGGTGPPPLLPSVEPQKVVTIRNDANLKKETLRLERDEENPGRLLVAFTFDATVPGSISIFFFAKEGPNCGLTSLKEDIIKPVRVPFEKGLGQNFRQPTGTGIDLSVFDDKDLSKEGPDEEFPIAVRADASSTSNSIDLPDTTSEQIGSPLPKAVNCQITQAVIGKKDNGEYNVRVVRQILWVNGVRYELQEIYGIGNSVGTDFDDNDPGKECVICMSEPRDTMILPCRHMCLCSGCTKVLRFQTKRCPICRQPVERLLEMKVNRNAD
eukprot:PITA_28789